MNRKHRSVKKLLFASVPFLKHQQSPSRVFLSRCRLAIDGLRLRVLRYLSKLLLRMRSGYVALIPYVRFEDDLMATGNYVDFLRDKRFTNAFHMSFSEVPEPVRALYQPKMMWRAHIYVWCINQALGRPGDLVELGVWFGVLARTACNYFVDEDRSKKKSFYLVDSYGKMEGSSLNPKYQKDIVGVVKNRFSDLPNVSVIQGAVPRILATLPLNSISFLSLDMNTREPERLSLEKLYPKLVPGALIYFDDFGQEVEGLVETVRDFLSDKPETVLEFPTGQAVVVKQ